jgi:hypothetical protein
MTCATPRPTSPAAAPRTARGAAALPNDPGLHAILADPKLSSTAKALIPRDSARVPTPRETGDLTRRCAAG